jgi:hypothetical protein
MNGALAEMFIVMTIFDDFLRPIRELFLGSDDVVGILGSELLVGIFLFIILFIFTFIFGLGMIVGSVALIPALFLVFGYIPSGRILLAIVLGLMVGLGFQRMVKR